MRNGITNQEMLSKKSRISKRRIGTPDDPYWDDEMGRWKLGGDTYVKIWQIKPSNDWADGSFELQYYWDSMMGWDWFSSRISGIDLSMYNRTWSGELNIHGNLEDLFSMLQDTRPMELSRALYSLSVGNLVTMDGVTYFVDKWGFKDVTSYISNEVRVLKKTRVAKREWEGNDYSPISTEQDIERALAKEYSNFDGLVKIQYVGTDWAMGSQYWVALFKCKGSMESHACVTVLDWNKYEPQLGLFNGIATMGYNYGTLEEMEQVFEEKVARESRGTRKSMMKSKGEKMKKSKEDLEEFVYQLGEAHDHISDAIKVMSNDMRGYIPQRYFEIVDEMVGVLRSINSKITNLSIDVGDEYNASAKKSKSVRKGKSINWNYKVLNIGRLVRDIENELYDTYWDNAPDRYWTETESNLYNQIDNGLDELESAVNRYYDLLSDADYSASAKKSKSVRKSADSIAKGNVSSIQRKVTEICDLNHEISRYCDLRGENINPAFDKIEDACDVVIERMNDFLPDDMYSASAKKSKRSMLKSKLDELMDEEEDEEEDEDIKKPMNDMFLDAKRKRRSKTRKSNDEKGEDADDYREESDGDDVSDSKTDKPEDADDNENDTDAPNGGDALPEDADGQENQSAKRKKRMSKFSVTAGGSQPYNGRENYNQSPMMREAIDRFKAEKDLAKSLQARVDEIHESRKNKDVNNSFPIKIKGRR